MPLEESLYPQDWFNKAGQDLRTIEILLREGGDAEVAGYHLQQAVEKYLKGYLLAQGWKLQRIHNLEVLLNEAIRFDPELERFRELCEGATDFYTLERYPFFSSPGITSADVSRLLLLLQQLIEYVEKMINGQ
jgi:HEPN domain-containing protein